ncbi:MAG: hypothetical protein IPP55_02775 [Anaerolineales bacterium]|nr:hypothetical protein [Anaerolineales bacterium]MBK9778965.1 hypothetical protein [Anaerolineales bacterium]
MKKRNQATIGMIAAIVLLACACPVTGLPALGGDATPTPDFSFVPPATEEVPTQAVQVPSNVLYSDDFSAPSAEMETYSGEDGTAGVENGTYVIRSTGDLWQWGKSTSQFADTVVDVDVTMTVGPTNDNAGFGVVCRLTEREDTSVDGYMIAISGDGYYSIRDITASNMTALVDWQFSDVINQGANATNHLKVTCSGSNLSLEVNGEVIATASATPGDDLSGSIAFSAISFETDQPVAEAHFDNLVISQP